MHGALTAMEEHRRIAAEYVLGTLDAGERADVRERMAADPGLAAQVRHWEERLAPLHELSASAQPPANLLDEIMAALPKEEREAPAGEPEAAAEAAEVAAAPLVAEPEAPSLAAAEAGTAEHASDRGADQAVEAPLVEVPSEALAAPDADTRPPPELPVPVASSISLAAVPVEVSVPEIPQVASEQASAAAGEGAVPPEATLEPAPPAPEKPPAPPPPPPPPIAPVEAPFNPWRLVSGLLALVLLFGGTALVYRELHRPLEKVEAPPSPAPAAPPPPAPAASQPDVAPAFFAVLSPQPMDGVALTLDPEKGEVSVLQLPAEAPAGMHYNLWVTSDVLGTRRLAIFRDASTIMSEELSSIGRGGLAGARLLLTLEPEGLEPPSPSGDAVFSGKAVPQ